jgi:hypothetical protein
MSIWKLGDIVQKVAIIAAVYGDILEIAKLFLRSLDYQIEKAQKDGDTEGANLLAFTRKTVTETINKLPY